ncbi:electron transfer flavoprotein subunit beta/FixA family protein [uncultured Vagococcus sp.]|uniref:electron transfer flavoprotein subunit beta/FixA family protein n=1 Tax=uncultured Vagococcus sp. TaxID=189676 RepID=UPI0028D7E68D|nr:electron transfer flavoprotein subunit beta/FixA family protein [uncultured Vagococcus sp.]
MNIMCLVKFVPDTEQYEYDYETDKINREKSRMILNPDDRNALAWALAYKKKNPETRVNVLTMGPSRQTEELKNIIRIGADQAILISDSLFAGSDSLTTSLVLATYLRSQAVDLILTGTHTLDGGTGHIGPQVAELLGINHFSNIRSVEEVNQDFSVVEAIQDGSSIRLKLQNPSVLSLTSQMNLRLGFVRYDSIDKNVDSQFSLVTNETLGLAKNQVGRKGSPTKVRQNVMAKRQKVAQKRVKVDDEGITEVINYLKEKAYL